MSARMLPGRQSDVCLIWGSRKLRSSKFKSGEPLTPVTVCPRAHALIFSVPQGKATGEGSRKQQSFAEMIQSKLDLTLKIKTKSISTGVHTQCGKKLIYRVFILEQVCLQAGSETHQRQKLLQGREFARMRTSTSS